jgi:hypothetical protein
MDFGGKTMKQLIVMMMSAAAVFAADLPKAEAVLDRYVEVTGGKAAYEKRKSEVTTATMEFVGMGIKGTMVSYSKPGSSYSMMDLPGIGKMESGVTNGVSWEKSALQGPRVRSGQENEEFLRMTAFNGPLRWREMYSKVETVGEETVEGKDCVKLQLTPKTGAPTTAWYEKESGLLVKMQMTMKTQMGEVPVESFASDYREVAGVKMPHATTQKLAGQTMKTVIEKVEVNAEIPEEKFEMPAEVKALAEKAKAAGSK